ncbi:phosphoenolpyruvate hydrolase family protein [Arenibacter sp. ARW7G5Y1]|uniref:phosphoenolpyruvate hydrolase family protein n=1 Tax=Arenibacter sp. ARW7G5Y1 TaxID=2135619 RepID=UPI001C64C4C3|nr:phosphoenolpyruvate hydrolase family protein [Arenibacter sp. ARW7G5Y1]
MFSLKNLVRDTSKISSPIISVVAGNGQITKSAVASGADMIIALNAGLYRNMGFGSLAAFMPYGNANDQTEQLLRQHILIHTKNTPVVAGVFAADSTQPIRNRLDRLKELGVEGITNWPAVGFIDGNFRSHLDAEGIDIYSEVEMLKQAKEFGFVTFGFALSAEEAFIFAKNGVDALILNVGLTFEIQDTIEKRNQLQLSITKAKEMLSRVHESGREPFSLIYGGSITEPEDFVEFFKQVPIKGYAGGSVFERFPVVETVNTRVRSFKSIFLEDHGTNHPEKFGTLIGSSPKMKNLFKLIQKIAPYDVNVCIGGESGTGKELVATQIHMLSSRKNNPFITVNCAAIPDTLVESEFFGYEKGAFTGATYRKLGKFELANKGTLFLDEIADLSPHAQAALLRVIQQGEIVTLGGQKPIPVDVRILCASNQNLEELVKEDKFRLDLYFRLSAITISIPPLRERIGDIPLLVANILNKLSIKFDKKLLGTTKDFMDQLKSNYWPGNVRELEQVVTRHSLIEDSPILQGDSTLFGEMTFPQQVVTLDKYQKAQKALIEAGYNKSKAALALGISRKTLYQWLESNN